MSIRILTDSASDMTLQELAEWGVTMIPMSVSCDGETYLDDKTVPVETFWEKLIGGAEVKTSQPSPQAFLKEFEEAKQVGDEVICVVISTELSGTYQGAMVARSMAGYEPVYIVDGKRGAASAAQKVLVMHACRRRAEGKLTAAQIAKELEELRYHVHLIACIDTLKYLARGGRLPKTVAQIGALVNIKPIFRTSREGGVDIIKKTIGYHRALRDMIAETLSYTIREGYPVIPLYACEDSNAKKFVKALQEAGFHHEIKAPEPIGATIGTYIGPGGYGIVFVAEE